MIYTGNPHNALKVTEYKLLAELQECGRVAVKLHKGRGKRGGAVYAGIQRWTAADVLIRLGLACQEGKPTREVTPTGQGNSVRTYTRVLRMADVSTDVRVNDLATA